VTQPGLATPTPAWKKLARIVAWPLMPGWPDEARRIVQGPMLSRLIDRTALAPALGLTILNAGAGEGSFSPLLLAVPGVTQVVEMDYSYRVSALITSDSRQQAVAASLTEIPIKSASVDLVLCSEVLEHIDDDGSALDELCRVLAPGGWLLISVPTPPAVYDHNHVREGYSAADLTRMLRERGLGVVEVAYCMYGAFKLVLRGWNRFGRLPRGILRTLAIFDRLWPIGTPMDLIILSQLPRGPYRQWVRRSARSAR
jgi:SAM-dependent methyltransferase